MREILKKMMCCAFLLCATVCFVACDKKDDPAPSPKVTGKITYKLNVYDLKDLMDISVTYADSTGKFVTEVVANSTWTKTLENVKIPFTAYLKGIFKKKANVSYTKESYKVAIYEGWTISSELSNGKKGTLAHDNPEMVPKSDMDKCLDSMEEIGTAVSKKINEQ